MPNFSVIDGDVTKVQSNALITAINSGKIWAGAVDRAIYKVAGTHFHDQAGSQELYEGKSVFAKGNGGTSFENVVFVVDDLTCPLEEVLFSALQEADAHGMEKVTVPAMRTGVMLGVVEKTKQEVVDRIGTAVQNFIACCQNVKEVVFVIYNDPAFQQALNQKLNYDTVIT